MDPVTFLIICILLLILLGTFVIGPYLLLSSFWFRRKARKGFAQFLSGMKGWQSISQDSATLEVPPHRIRATVLGSSDAGFTRYQLRNDTEHLVRVPSPFQGPVLMLEVDCSHPAEFSISHETLLDKLAKKSGLSVEIQTKNPAFDPRCYVSCKDSQFIVEYLNPRRQAAILKLFDLGFQQLTYFAGQLNLYSSTKFLLGGAGLSQAKTIIEEFTTFTSNESGTSYYVSSGATAVRDSWLPDLAAGALMVIILMFGYGRAIGDQGLLMRDSAVIALISSVVYFLYLKAKHGGSSTFHRRSLFRIPVCLILTYTIATFGIAAINCSFDQSSPEKMAGAFRGISYSRIGRASQYRPFADLSFVSKSGKHLDTRLRISEERALALQGRENSAVKLYVHEGVLGYQWIADFAVE